MAKRKREDAGNGATTPTKKRAVSDPETKESKAEDAIHLQIITGSYERVLHGIIATIPRSQVQDPEEGSGKGAATFSDTFMFNAHTSAIRCLALSPPSTDSATSQRRILASGSTDERINLYHISNNAPSTKNKPSLPTLSGTATTEDPKNRELGSLLHHASTVTSLYFLPNRSKLFSGAEDNTIAITRIRDWTALSTLKAPIPKPVGRPSGDTAGPGEVPAGVNDFAVHPSMKVMLSVHKGERCMRSWDVTKGKKAGVLSFEKGLLQQVGEGKHSTGEGHKIEWDVEGEEFVVAFERGAVVLGIDMKPKGVIRTTPFTKIHHIQYVPVSSAGNVLAVSTEDGRILFFSTKETVAADDSVDGESTKSSSLIPSCKLLAQLGGRSLGVTGRVKDFRVEEVEGMDGNMIIATGGSDGSVRVWSLGVDELASSGKGSENGKAKNGKTNTNGTSTLTPAKQVGRLLGIYNTNRRITCLEAFVMGAPSEDNGDGELGVEEAVDNQSSDSSDEESE